MNNSIVSYRVSAYKQTFPFVIARSEVTKQSLWDSSLLLRLGSGQGSEWHSVSDRFVEFTLSAANVLAMTGETQ